MSDERHLTKTEQSIMQKALHRSMKFLPDCRDDEIKALVAAAFDLAEYACAIELARIHALNRPEALPEVVRAVYLALLPFKKEAP